MATEPSLTNTPQDRRIADAGRLRARLLKKEESRVYDPQELSDKSLPLMFVEDWQPLVVDEALTTKTPDEVAAEAAAAARTADAAALARGQARDMKVLRGLAWGIGGFLALCALIVAVCMIVRSQKPKPVEAGTAFADNPAFLPTPSCEYPCAT